MFLRRHVLRQQRSPFLSLIMSCHSIYYVFHLLLLLAKIFYIPGSHVLTSDYKLKLSRVVVGWAGVGDFSQRPLAGLNWAVGRDCTLPGCISSPLQWM